MTVLPDELKIARKVNISDLSGIPFVVLSVKFITAGDTVYSTMRVKLDQTGEVIEVTSNQQHVNDVLKYLADNGHLPIRATFSPFGKSYMLADPSAK